MKVFAFSKIPIVFGDESITSRRIFDRGISGSGEERVLDSSGEVDSLWEKPGN